MKYLACSEADYNPATGECVAMVWVDSPSWQDGMPSYADSTLIGSVFFISWFTLAAMKYLLKPPRTSD